jgi:hypothetical protein
VALPYGEQLVDDVVNRTETAMTQAHCFLATELVLEAQAQASRITGAADSPRKNGQGFARGDDATNAIRTTVRLTSASRAHGEGS